MARKRVDIIMVERGLAESRQRAQRIIRAGLVVGPDRLLDKPGQLVDEAIEIRVKGPDHPYVSRGGVKLQGALDVFAHDPSGETALDVGAGTGGFTDCLLQRGAERVIAVDVGRAQLHQRLLLDSRVSSHEKTHLDAITTEITGGLVDVAVTDVSFITVTRALIAIRRTLRPGGRAVILVKPQFELGKGIVPRGGVVRDPALHAEAVRSVRDFAMNNGFEVLGETPSPIAGGDGNQEFFLYLEKASED